MLNTIIREIVILSGEGRGAAIAAVVLFVVFVVVIFFGTLATIQTIVLCYKNEDHLAFNLIVLIIQIIGSLLYFYGDNFMYILNRYASELGCDSQCVNINRILSVVCLGCTLIIFHLIPPCLKKIAEYKKLNNNDHWYAASNIITTIIKVDALFTVVAIMAQTSEFCSDADLGISAAFFVISIFVGWGLMGAYATISCFILDDANSKPLWLVPLATVALAISLPFYILADNEQPLDCGFDCDTFASNGTQNDLTCDVTTNSAIRLSFTIITFIVVSSVSILLFFFREDTKADEIDAEDGIELKETTEKA